MNPIEWKLHAKTRDYLTHLALAKESIIQSLNTGRKFYVSFSGGKDSAVMLHLVLLNNPRIPVLNIKSGYALPDTENYINQVEKEWNLNLFRLNVPVDYLDLCSEFGLPHLRSRETQKKIVKMIKKDIASEWAKEKGFGGLFWGLRADESKGRKMLYKCHHDGVIDRNNILRVAPLSSWTAKDVWTYTFSNDIAYNRLYDKENCGYTRELLRNTGWLSTDGENRGQIEWLRRNYPEQFQKVRELI